MSDVMLIGVLRMPYEIWHDSVFDKMQRHSYYVEAANRIEAQEAEIERLRERLRIVGDDADGTIARLRADAERYRWLRETHRPRWRLMACNEANSLWYDYLGAELDAAIDAARKPANEADASRSARLTAAGFTRRDTRLQCDECGKFFSPQFLPIHKCDAEDAE